MNTVTNRWCNGFHARLEWVVSWVWAPIRTINDYDIGI